MKTFVIILDESKSMSTMGPEPVEAVNEFILTARAAAKPAAENCVITLYTFNQKVTKKWDRVPLNDVVKFEDYLPTATTALNDAIGKAITEHTELENVSVVIVTDGAENSSRTFGHEQVKELIKDKTDGGWTFMFLAANQDAFATGGSYGIDANRSANFVSQNRGDFTGLMRQVSHALSQPEPSLGSAVAKEAGAKEAGAKEAGAKEAGAKEAGAKEAGAPPPAKRVRLTRIPVVKPPCIYCSSMNQWRTGDRIMRQRLIESGFDGEHPPVAYTNMYDCKLIHKRV